MNDPLAPLLADGVVEEVCARLKSGKEADLWLVRHGGEVVAAKVYKAREARNFRNNAGYREGRQVRDTRMQRAMDRGSRFGQAAAEEAWKAKEADALYALHAAGVRVPRPVMFYEGVLLMEVVVDAHGHPAPRLVDAHVAPDQAAALYADLRGQMVRMLGADLIHGDLSPYNVLVGWDGPVVIDFPQVVGAAHNSRAEFYFERDLENLRRFFAALDPSLRAASNDAREIWRAYVRRELTPDFVPSGRAPEAPRGGGERHERHGGGQGERHRPAHPGNRRNDARGRGRPERPERPERGGGAGGGHSSREAHPPSSERSQPQGGNRRRNGSPERGQPQGGDRRPSRPPERGQPQGGDRRSSRPPERGQPQGSDRRPNAARPPGPGQGSGNRPPGRGQDRRSAPAPEVIRVVRPPLGPGAPSAPPPERPPSTTRPPHGGPQAQGQRSHPRRGRR
ncbi:RIO1 family regulatory kinase/ATPase [Anaeromyxobacter sp. Fw109-5]|uniref:RIO1 family regulatory kinase/ATPase domain-containing protein n=1 Tax=Anaeromyxobacter sp. (strain Fw109-5) TaxID=404589 RepID=UPI0000ED8AE0|nr:RIO1 family regulatory kinase/ATPase [Anaeromyxobacter sp. Fw109-5]ABS27301.1 protein of unknown function RIO1 [Anaeromyxobacter sp. Fw109-5]